MRNAPRMSAGEDLVNFYMTPGYWTWDPSGVVLVSFAIFFAMILADAGYAAVMGLGLLLVWRPLGRSASGRRFRPLLSLIVLVSLVYGVLVGSYFGIAPPKKSFLGRLHLLDMSNTKLMMGLSILVGAAHVMLANIMDARRYADLARRAGFDRMGRGSQRRVACRSGSNNALARIAEIPWIHCDYRGAALGCRIYRAARKAGQATPPRGARIDQDLRCVWRYLELSASVCFGAGVGFAWRWRSTTWRRESTKPCPPPVCCWRFWCLPSGTP